jgi:uncharacterized Zn-binding protein involved in type VI secretion
MPAVARKDGVDTVSINHATCQGSTVTAAGSLNVFVNNIGVVRKDDAVESHTFAPPVCPSHAPGLVSFSANVFVNSLNIGRLGDEYGCSANISSGSSNVFAN